MGLLSGLEDARNLLLIGAGCRGIAPLRAAIEWTPVQAHSTAHRVTLFYFAPSAQSAAYLKDWCALFPLLLAYIVILSQFHFVALGQPPGGLSRGAHSPQCHGLAALTGQLASNAHRIWSVLSMAGNPRLSATLSTNRNDKRLHLREILMSAPRDLWREAGVQVHPVYLEGGNGSAAPDIWVRCSDFIDSHLPPRSTNGLQRSTAP